MTSRTSAAWGRIAAIAAFALLCALPAGATSYTWSNAVGGSWSAAANWSPSGVPAAGDAVTLPNLGGGYAVTLDANASIAALTLGSGATLQMASADSLTYTGTSLHNDGTIVIGPTLANSFFIANTSDTLQIAGAGEIQLQGQGRLFSTLSRPTLHYRVVNGAGHTISGDGNVFVPLINRGTLVQAGTGAKLLTLVQYLFNAGTVRVSDGGTVLVRYAVTSNGGTIVGHNGWFKVQPTDQADLYNYGPIDGLQGGLTMIADGGSLDVLAGVVTSAHILQSGGSGVVGFHNTGNPNNFVVTPGAELLLDGGTNYHTDLSSIENHGIVHVMGTLSLGTAVGDTVGTSSDGTIDLMGGTLTAGLNMAGARQWVLNTGTITGCGTIDGNFINAGTIDVDCSSFYESITAPQFVNRGRIQVTRGYLRAISAGSSIRNIGTIDGATGGILVNQGATIQNAGGVLTAGSGNVRLGGGSTTAAIVGGTLAARNGGYFENDGTSTLTDVTLSAGATFYTTTHAVTNARGASLVNLGTNDVKTGGQFLVDAATDYLQQPGAVTLLEGGSLGVPRGFTVVGALRGTGTVVGNVTNAGEVSPAVSAAGLQVEGDYHQQHGAMLGFGVGGYAADLYSHLAVTGSATLDGKVSLLATGGFVPQAGHTFGVMSFGARTGQFTLIDASPGLQVQTLYDDASVALETSMPLGVGGPALPASIALEARGTAFALSLPQPANVELSAYDVTGRRVARLASGARPAGVQTFDLAHLGLPSGVYFARASLRTGAQTVVREARLVVLH